MKIQIATENTLIKDEPFQVKQVLIVDDNPFNIVTLRNLFKKLGVPTDSSINGLEAIEKIEKAHSEGIIYDLVVMDIMMPIMNGIQVKLKIKDRPPRYSERSKCKKGPLRSFQLLL